MHAAILCSITGISLNFHLNTWKNLKFTVFLEAFLCWKRHCVVPSVNIVRCYPMKLLDFWSWSICKWSWKWSISTGWQKRSEKSNHFVWSKNKVKLLFLAHHLREKSIFYPDNKKIMKKYPHVFQIPKWKIVQNCTFLGQNCQD